MICKAKHLIVFYMKGTLFIDGLLTFEVSIVNLIYLEHQPFYFIFQVWKYSYLMVLRSKSKCSLSSCTINIVKKVYAQMVELVFLITKTTRLRVFAQILIKGNIVKNLLEKVSI